MNREDLIMLKVTLVVATIMVAVVLGLIHCGELKAAVPPEQSTHDFAVIASLQRMLNDAHDFLQNKPS